MIEHIELRAERHVNKVDAEPGRDQKRSYFFKSTRAIDSSCKAL